MIVTQPRQTSRARAAAIGAVLAIVGLFTPIAAADGTITLRPIARVGPGQPLLLSTVATLVGDDAASLGALELPLTGDEVSIDDLREALATKPAINWGRLTLAGSKCRIVIVRPVSEPAEPTAPTVTHVAAPASGPTLRSILPARIAESLGIAPDRLRLEFDDHGPDAALLDESITGRTLDIRPMGASDRLPISVTMYEQDRIVAQGTLRARTTTLRDVLVTRGPIGRGESISEINAERREVWLPLSARVLAPDDAIGRVARARIAADRTISPQDAQAPIAIHKGDQAFIHCVSGSIILKLRARALEDGGVGDSIPFAGMDGRKDRVIMARVDAPGVAIATDGPEPQSDPSPRSDEP